MSYPTDAAALPAVIGEAVHWGAAQIAGVSRRQVQTGDMIDARALLMDCLAIDEYAALLAAEKQPLAAGAAAAYQRYIAARAAGEPVAYILGWREFYSRRFKTTPVALIPRCETELLVEAALAYIPPSARMRVLDLGCGCGAIGINIALLRASCVLMLTDVSEQTLALARENAARLKADNVRFFCGDWYEPLAAAHSGGFDVIISNPPYVAANDDYLRRGDLRFEPPLALVGGEDGLAALSQVVSHAPQMLQRGGALLVEHGSRQAAAVREFFAAAGFCGIRTLNDLAGLPRVTLAVLP